MDRTNSILLLSDRSTASSHALAETHIASFLVKAVDKICPATIFGIARAIRIIPLPVYLFPLCNLSQPLLSLLIELRCVLLHGGELRYAVICIRLALLAYWASRPSSVGS